MGPHCCQWIFTALRARWKRLALFGVLSLTVLTVVLNTALVDTIQSIRIWSTSEPPLNFSQIMYPSSLEHLPAHNKYWKQYNSSWHKTGKLKQCSEKSSDTGLNGTRVEVDTSSPTFDVLARRHSNVRYGGHWFPSTCSPRYRVAVIIPYRNREAHLRTFLNNIHPFLQRQHLDYAIFIVEQKSGTMFNRGMLMNIGFNEARKLYDFQCYAFHDVDLVPEDIRNYYTCAAGPRHLSAAVDKFDYKLLYATLFGGATILKKADVIKTNGFSNVFWGWGGEDDDFYERTRYAGLKMVRYPLDIARYKMLSHKPDKENPVNPRRYTLIRTGKRRYKLDGVNSARYERLRVEAKRLFTWIYVHVKGAPS